MIAGLALAAILGQAVNTTLPMHAHGCGQERGALQRTADAIASFRRDVAPPFVPPEHDWRA